METPENPERVGPTKTPAIAMGEFVRTFRNSIRPYLERQDIDNATVLIREAVTELMVLIGDTIAYRGWRPGSFAEHSTAVCTLNEVVVKERNSLTPNAVNRVLSVVDRRIDYLEEIMQGDESYVGARNAA